MNGMVKMSERLKNCCKFGRLNSKCESINIVISNESKNGRLKQRSRCRQMESRGKNILNGCSEKLLNLETETIKQRPYK